MYVLRLSTLLQTNINTKTFIFLQTTNYEIQNIIKYSYDETSAVLMLLPVENVEQVVPGQKTDL